MLANSFLVYLKTAEHCQLACTHCFSASDKVPKTILNFDKAISWFEDLNKFAPWVETPSINFFGGEPMLAPVKDMISFIQRTKDLWEGRIRYMITTNLVYALTSEKIEFFKMLDGMSTSWDQDIRFANTKQFDLWKKNCIELIHTHKIPLSLQISLSKETVNLPIDQIYSMTKEIGFTDVQFEKLSLAGNLFDNLDLIPKNEDLDSWFVSMYDSYVNNSYYENFSNSYLNSILTSILYNTYSGCRSRNCETKVFTINADGTIANCPNNASYKKSQIGTLDDSIISLMSSKNRQKNISCEAKIDERCLDCSVYDICAGGCVRSTTEMWKKSDVHCPEAKSLMITLKKEKNYELYKKLMNGFQGSENPNFGT